jgi:hypothetical protein
VGVVRRQAQALAVLRAAWVQLRQVSLTLCQRVRPELAPVALVVHLVAPPAESQGLALQRSQLEQLLVLVLVLKRHVAD